MNNLSYKNVLIFGGTGTLGKVLIDRIIEQKLKVYVYTRQPEKHAELLQKGVQLIQGDLIHHEAIDQAIQGKDVVIWSAHSVLGRGKYSSGLIDEKSQWQVINSCLKYNTKQILVLSVIGASEDNPIDFWRTKWKMEEAWKTSGLPCTIIRASAFMETHTWQLFGKMIQEKEKAIILGRGEALSNYVSVKDIAELIILCLYENKHLNQTYEIGGIDNVSRLQIAQMISQQLQTPIKIIKIPRLVLKIMGFIMKPFHSGISRIMKVSLYTDQKNMSFDVNPLLAQIPLKITRLKDFIQAKIQESKKE